MTEVIGNLSFISEAYNSAISFLPPSLGIILNLFLLTLVVLGYSILIWKFYSFIAQKDFLGLNLKKYNSSNSPFFEKLFAAGLYFLEYLVISPILIFIWFGVFTFLLILISEEINVEVILIVSAVVIAAIRMSSYYSKELSIDLAKMLPLTLLAVSILNRSTFNFERIINHFVSLPGFINKIFIYLLFIFIIELILRFFEFTFSIFGLTDSETE